MNVLQHTRNERNPCLKQNRPDRSYLSSYLSLESILGLYTFGKKKKKQTGSTDGLGKNFRKGCESIIIAWYSKIIFPQLPSALFLKHPIKFRFQPHWRFSTVSSTGYFEDRYFHHISFCIRCLCSIKFAFLREVESHLHIHTSLYLNICLSGS